MRTDELVWSPVCRVLEKRIHTGDLLILLVAPFIKVDALQRLCEAQKGNAKLSVVCRWHPEDIVSGASDLDVYSYLKGTDSKLYLNSDIHLVEGHGISPLNAR